MQMWSEQLEAVRAELKDVPTIKLIEMLDTLSEKLKTEAYDWNFESKPITKPYEVELLTRTDRLSCSS